MRLKRIGSSCYTQCGRVNGVMRQRSASHSSRPTEGDRDDECTFIWPTGRTVERRLLREPVSSREHGGGQSHWRNIVLSVCPQFSPEKKRKLFSLSQGSCSVRAVTVPVLRITTGVSVGARRDSGASRNGAGSSEH